MAEKIFPRTISSLGERRAEQIGEPNWNILECLKIPESRQLKGLKDAKGLASPRLENFFTQLPHSPKNLFQLEMQITLIHSNEQPSEGRKQLYHSF